ncbi:cellulose synthase A catalytic subunit 4 [UDP-forming] [Cryptomeria japonica]|uniref:cellulose synthase A catalytic subunit 4 [UDP-forming] n=1 Tax=Cryptomeria japonica TaxID=3369 RepID=UPI0027DA5399|nr:cellulose synthase A catalytic subunit 4 [UDP-forming] [Cryptomeria japonica]
MILEVFAFSHKWIPLCKSHSIEPHSPAKFFSSHTTSSLSEQRNELKEEYEQLENRVNDLAQKPQEALNILQRYTSWDSDNPYGHPPIVEVHTEDKNQTMSVPIHKHKCIIQNLCTFSLCC